MPTYKSLRGQLLLEDMQSAYRRGHSVETALVRVSNNILHSIDNRQMVLLHGSTGPTCIYLLPLTINVYCNDYQSGSCDWLCFAVVKVISR